MNRTTNNKLNSNKQTTTLKREKVRIGLEEDAAVATAAEGLNYAAGWCVLAFNPQNSIFRVTSKNKNKHRAVEITVSGLCRPLSIAGLAFKGSFVGEFV